MFRTYGIVGLVMILFAELGLFLRIEPFVSFFFLFVWFGYILLLDAIVYKLQGNSLIMNRKGTLLLLFILSASAWWMFELLGRFYLENWYYLSSVETASGAVVSAKYWTGALRFIGGTLAFSTVIPAVFETAGLIKAFHLFDHKKLKRKKKRHYIRKSTLYFMILLGILSLLISAVFPIFGFGLIWIAFFLILDPINYMHHEPSIIGYLKRREFAIPAAFFIAGYVTGFFWEFWNYWAIAKWKYSFPVFGALENIKIFEMPVLGFLAYGFFALELFSMYYFVRLLKREAIYVEKKVLHMR